MPAKPSLLASLCIAIIVIFTFSLPTYSHTVGNQSPIASQPTSHSTASKYYYPLATGQLFSHLSTVIPLSALTCWLSFICSAATPKAKPIAYLSGAITLGSLAYAEYAYRKALYNIPIKQITVPTQNKDCVIHALANALTVQDLVLSNKKLDLPTLSTIDNSYFYNHIYKILPNIIHTDPKLGLNDYMTAKLIAQLNKTESIFQLYYFQIGDTTNQEYRTLQKQVAQLRNQLRGTIHIKCNLTYPDKTDLHAVMISLVKQPNKKISMIYMDSNNVPLRFCPQAVEYIRFIHDNLLQ